MDSVDNTIHNHMFDNCRNIMIISLYNVFYINGILILLLSTNAYLHAHILVIYMTECGDNTDTYRSILYDRDNDNLVTLFK